MVVFLCFLQLNSQKLTCALKRLVGRHTVPFEMVPFLRRNLLLAASSIYSLSLKPTVPKLLWEILWRGHPPLNLACPSLHPGLGENLQSIYTSGVGFFSPQRIRWSRKRPQGPGRFLKHTPAWYIWKSPGVYKSSNHMVQHIAKTERLRKNQGYKPMGFSLGNGWCRVTTLRFMK